MDTQPLSVIKVGENFSREELGDISALKASMEKHGLLQPIIIDRNRNLVAGFRRYHAATELGWNDIAVVVTDEDPRMVNLIENLDRESLSFYEEAKAIHHLFPDCTDQQVADALGRTTGWSRPRNQLFKLPQEVIEAVRNGDLLASHVSGILGSKDRSAAIDRALNGNPTSRASQRPGKKQIQQTITIALERDLPDVAQALRYAIGDINEEELWDEVDKE